VGAVLHAYLSHVAHLVSLNDELTADAAAAEFSARLPRAQQEMRAFWNAYVAAGAAPAGELRERAILVSGARLVQSAWEWCQGEHDIPRAAIGMLQLAVNIITRPQEARAMFLGAGNS
jgi:hypothetical protein